MQCQAQGRLSSQRASPTLAHISNTTVLQVLLFDQTPTPLNPLTAFVQTQPTLPKPLFPFRYHLMHGCTNQVLEKEEQVHWW